MFNQYNEQYEKLLESGKLVWFEEDMERLVDSSLDPLSEYVDLKRTQSKQEENLLLFKLNQLVEEIACEAEINKTMFLSKKAQKDFVRLIGLVGFEEALKGLTNWRKNLIRADLEELFL